jgi:hypothetical protein
MPDELEEFPEQKPLWPSAWRYYNVIVASIGAILVLFNTLIGLELWHSDWDRYLNVAISLLVAFLIWLNERRRQLYGNNGDHPRSPSELQADIANEVASERLRAKHRAEAHDRMLEDEKEELVYKATEEAPSKPTEDLIERAGPKHAAPEIKSGETPPEAGKSQ